MARLADLESSCCVNQMVREELCPGGRKEGGIKAALTEVAWTSPQVTSDDRATKVTEVNSSHACEDTCDGDGAANSTPPTAHD